MEGLVLTWVPSWFLSMFPFMVFSSLTVAFFGNAVASGTQFEGGSFGFLLGVIWLILLVLLFWPELGGFWVTAFTIAAFPLTTVFGAIYAFIGIRENQFLRVALSIPPVLAAGGCYLYGVSIVEEDGLLLAPFSYTARVTVAVGIVLTIWLYSCQKRKLPRFLRM